MSDFNHALNLTHDGTLILRIPKGYEADKVVVEEMGTGNRKKFVHMPADISDYCDELWDKAYERGKAEGREKGKWLRSGSDIFPYECDQCGDTNERRTPWCPHCGCRMEEGDSE